MKKKIKFGLNSGNTISFGTKYSRIKRHNCEQDVFVKTLIYEHIQPVNFYESNQQIEQIINEVTSIVNDGGCQYGVEYSMNKRKRWTLKERILKSIENLREHEEFNITKSEENQFSISLTERVADTPYTKNYAHLAHDCTAYHSSGTKQASTYPSSKYAFETDLEHKANSKPVVDKRKHKKEKRKKGHNQHFRDLQRQRNDFGKKKRKKKQKTHEEQLENNMHWLFQAQPVGQERPAENQIPEINYEICTPRPITAHHCNNDCQRYYCGRDEYRHTLNKSWNKCKGFKNKGYNTITGYSKKQLCDIGKYKTATGDGIYVESENNFELYENVLEKEETVAENVHNEPHNCIYFSHLFDKVEKDKNNNNNKLKQKSPNKHQEQNKAIK